MRIDITTGVTSKDKEQRLKQLHRTEKEYF